MKKIITLLALLYSSIGVAADVAISALPSATTLAGTEVFPIVQGGVTKKSTLNLIASQLYPSLTGTPAARCQSVWTGTTTQALVCTTVTGTVLIDNGITFTTSDLLGTLQLGKSGTLGTLTMGNATSGTVTLSPVTGALGTVTTYAPASNTYIPIVSQQLTISGPTAARTVTVPDDNFTVARTDAANTFTGAQNIGTLDVGNTDTTITRSAAGVIAIEGVVSTRTIASGTSALGTSAIASGACATVVTTSATGTLTTDTISHSFNTDISAVTGYSGVGTLVTIYKYPTADNVNWKVCNWTGASITPGAVTVNWKVLR